jgi:hypothetical protein
VLLEQQPLHSNVLPSSALMCPQVPELGANARAYEERAGKYLSKYNVSVVDVGIANIEYPATTLQQARRLTHASYFSRVHTHCFISYRRTVTPQVLLFLRSSTRAAARGGSGSWSGLMTARPSSTLYAQAPAAAKTSCSITEIRLTSQRRRWISPGALSGPRSDMQRKASRCFCSRLAASVSSAASAIFSSCYRIAWQRCRKEEAESSWWLVGMSLGGWLGWRGIYDVSFIS